MNTKMPVWATFSVITIVAAGSIFSVQTQSEYLINDMLTANVSMHRAASHSRKKATPTAINSARQQKTNRYDMTASTPITTSETTSESTPQTPQPIEHPLVWGVFTGWRATDLAAFESHVSASVDMQAVFVHWGNENEFPSAVAAELKPANKTLVIFWEAMDYNGHITNQPNFSYDAILAGNWDAYISSFARAAKAYGGPVILIPFEEMNGDWYPWSGTKNNNSAEKHIAAYRHVREIFNTVGSSNVRFGWVPNANSVPATTANSITRYYPGDAYVDYVGVNGFNFGDPWLSFNQIFGSALSTLSQYNKPLYIFSFASAQGAQKAAWITDAMSQMSAHPTLAGWIWFNENKEKDWRVWSDEASLAAFKAAIN